MIEEIEKQAEEYELDCIADVHRDDVCTIPYAYSAQKLEQAFQDGAKWGMEHAIQWHDLRENPNDLPKEKGEYRVYFYDSELKANRNVNWYYYGKSWGCRLDVIAWCELPQFKE